MHHGNFCPCCQMAALSGPISSHKEEALPNCVSSRAQPGSLLCSSVLFCLFCKHLLILTFDFFDAFCLTLKVLSSEAFPAHLPPVLSLPIYFPQFVVSLLACLPSGLPTGIWALRRRTTIDFEAEISIQAFVKGALGVDIVGGEKRSRTGQRETLGHNAVTTDASAHPTESSEDGMTLQNCPDVGWRPRSLDLCSIDNWMWAAPARDMMSGKTNGWWHLNWVLATPSGLPKGKLSHHPRLESSVFSWPQPIRGDSTQHRFSVLSSCYYFGGCCSLTSPPSISAPHSASHHRPQSRFALITWFSPRCHHLLLNMILVPTTPKFLKSRTETPTTFSGPHSKIPCPAP